MEKHIKIPHIYVSYPVGQDLKGVKELVSYFSIAFKEYAKEGEKGFNLWCRGSSGAILATYFA